MPTIIKNFNFDSQAATYYFTQRDYEIVGRELAGTLLDLIGKNPVSRLANSPIKNTKVD